MTQLPEDLRAIFDNHVDDFRRQVATLEEAVAAIVAGTLDEDLRAAAERDAHKLAGSLGSFGMERGSELALQLEQGLAPSQLPAAGHAPRVAMLIRGLRGELDGQIADTMRDGSDGSAPVGVSVGERGDHDGRAQDGQERASEIVVSGAEPAAAAAGRVLVVDDDEPVRQLLASILSDAGYDVRAVGSAREARHALEHDTIALLLSDVRMPEETGLDLISHALSKHPQTATLLISALEDPGITQVALDLGAYGYLSKPVRRSAVLIGVMNALRRRDTEARERAARETLEQTVRLRTDALSQTLAGLEHAAKRSHALQAETIHRWAQAAEHRQPGVRAHLTRVSRYCAVLADDLGLHAASVELASVLHDIGKLVIPDSILLKPAPLTADERLAIETHAEVGHQMLSGSSSDILDLAATIAWCHHERFDGRGYPRGLAGTEIPLEGRIAAVADAFDALTCDRAYRQACSPDEAISWMARHRGKHFDPGVLDAFTARSDEILAIHTELAVQ